MADGGTGEVRFEAVGDAPSGVLVERVLPDRARQVRTVVVVETQEDAQAFARLHPQRDSILVVTGGPLTDQRKRAVAEGVSAASHEIRWGLQSRHRPVVPTPVLVATGATAEGAALAREVANTLVVLGGAVTVERHAPRRGRWVDTEAGRDAPAAGLGR